MLGISGGCHRHLLTLSFLGILSVSLYGGCQRRPARVPAPSWDPEQIANRALEMLDANGDSALDSEEAKKAPGLAAAFSRVDTNRDGRMSAEEIKSRIELYERVGTGLTSQTFLITVNGRPLADAWIEFMPEKFLGGVIKQASGRTDVSGYVVPQTVEQPIPAMQVGFYQVVAHRPLDEKPLETSSSVGVEVSPVSTEDESGTPVLRFKSS